MRMDHSEFAGKTRQPIRRIAQRDHELTQSGAFALQLTYFTRKKEVNLWAERKGPRTYTAIPNYGFLSLAIQLPYHHPAFPITKHTRAT
jgi:hypothetical protein